MLYKPYIPRFVRSIQKLYGCCEDTSTQKRFREFDKKYCPPPLKILPPCAGFTLIEVLLALAIIAIALTALIKASSANVVFTYRLKEKTIAHWVAMQGVTMVQLGLLPIDSTKETTQVTTIMGERWYWRAKILPTKIKSMQEISITTSKNQSGPFIDPLLAYRRIPEVKGDE